MNCPDGVAPSDRIAQIKGDVAELSAAIQTGDGAKATELGAAYFGGQASRQSEQWPDGWDGHDRQAFMRALAAQSSDRPRITWAHELDGPWRLELNGVTVSTHELRPNFEAARDALMRACGVTEADKC